MATRIVYCLSLLGLPFMASAKIQYKYQPGPQLELNCGSAYAHKDYGQAMHQCLKEAEAGDPNAIALVGLMHHRGLGCPKDDQKAAQFFEQAAENGSRIAQYHLGKMYLLDTVIPQNETLAFKWFEKSAAQLFAPAEFLLALCYRNGIGVTMNLNEADQWFQKAKAHGLSDAAEQTYVNIQPALVPDLDPHAAYLLAKSHLSGQEGIQNDALALQYFEQAAQQNHPDAQGYLAWMLTLGLGGTMDLPQALYWFNAALRNEHYDQQTTISALKTKAYSVQPKTPKQQYEMGKSMIESPLQDADRNNGLIYMHLSAEQDYHPAESYLANLYQHGKYVPANHGLALALAEKAAASGDPKAQYTLGWYYANGIGTQRDLTKAEYCFAAVAKTGDRRAKRAKKFLNTQLALQQATAHLAEPLLVEEATPEPEVTASTTTSDSLEMTVSPESPDEFDLSSTETTTKETGLLQFVPNLMQQKLQAVAAIYHKKQRKIQNKDHEAQVSQYKHKGILEEKRAAYEERKAQRADKIAQLAADKAMKVAQKNTAKEEKRKQRKEKRELARAAKEKKPSVELEEHPIKMAAIPEEG